MNKRTILLLVLTVALAAACTACGDKSEIERDLAFLCSSVLWPAGRL